MYVSLSCLVVCKVRVAAEVLSSNGSSSMATACAATLACLDAGVPLVSPVAGVSIGMVSRPRSANLTNSSLAGASLSSGGGDGQNTGAALSADGPSGQSTSLSTSSSFSSSSSPGKVLVQAKSDHELEYVLLTDILGLEDHYGDMDFKVAGSRKGVTAVQLDVKLAGGVPLEVLEEAIDLATSARGQILDRMEVQRQNELFLLQ